jgi:hypothetical protein
MAIEDGLVARIYAGILGPLAFLTSSLRGLTHGGSTESVLLTAWFCLLVFAAMGYAIGWIGQRTVEEAVRGRMAAEMTAQRSAAKKSEPAAIK